MGLFKKTPKLYHKTYTAKCPTCGKEHTATACIGAQRHLDGTPMMTMEQCLSKFIICNECGYIFDISSPGGGLHESKRQEYQTLAGQHYDNEYIKKLTLLRMLSRNQERNWMWLRYYQAVNQPAEVYAVLQEMISNPQKTVTPMGNDSFMALSLPCQCFFPDELRDIDLLRQMGRFDDAHDRISYYQQHIKEPKFDCFEEYLKIERKLVNKRDTKQY